MHQVSRVVEAVNAHSPDGETLIDAGLEKFLRLTALCHDIGHGAMSHVSENAMRNFESVETLRLQFSRQLQIEKPGLSEIAAYFIIGSTGFAELVATAESIVRDTDMPRETVALMQRAIVGKPVDEKLPLLHELISGPFDADKLDYMTRDARMSGVPVVTDVPRLVQKIRAMELPLTELPEKVQTLVKDKESSYWLTGIDLSGGRTLDELLIGRTFLFDKLYRHHKVRATEAMVAALFRELGELRGTEPAMLPYLLDDNELVDLTPERIAAVTGKPVEEAASTAAALIAEDLAHRLRNRRLFVRAYAFAQTMPLDPYRDERSHANGLRRLLRDAVDPAARGALVERIADEVGRVATAVGEGARVEELPGGNVKAYLWLDPPQPPSGASVVASAYLLGDERRWLRFAEETAEAPSWTNAYLLTRDVGYLFTIAELAPFSFIAAERVLREEYGIRTPRMMIGYAKQSDAKLGELKSRLSEAGYYDGAPHDLRPQPERLQAGDVKAKLLTVEKNLAGYQGPVREADLRDERKLRLANPQRMQDWLRQFQDDDLIDAGLRVLERVEVLGRQDLVRGLDNFLRDHQDFHNGALCPLGEPKDSSSILTYESLDAGATYGMTISTVGAALAESKPVVFVDDFVGRGSQTISVIEAWLDVEPRTVKLGEERHPLDPAVRELLRSANVGFVYSAGTEEGRQAVQDRASELGINATVWVARTDLPTAHEPSIYASEEQRETFLERCRLVGQALLVNAEQNHDEEWAAERALGYGNKALLFVFPYNTPTATLTALWATGVYEEIEWQPLFPRRKKL